MDTLKRMGSIRKSLRKASPKKTASPLKAVKPPEDEGGGGGLLSSGPTSLEPTAAESPLKKVFFTITVNDASVQPATGFQPTRLTVTIDRGAGKKGPAASGSSQKWTSIPVLWEAALTTSSSGVGVWHPPFVAYCAVTPPVWKSSSGTLRHKDAHVSLHNVDLAGKRKLLAKVRINLTDYYDTGKTAFKLKLRPESTKVVAASVNLVVEKTESDPRLPVDSGLPAGIEDPLIDETLSVHIPEVVPSSSTQKPQALRLGQSREDLQSEHEEDKKSDSGAESPSFDPPPKPPPRTIVRLDTQLSTPMPVATSTPMPKTSSKTSIGKTVSAIPVFENESQSEVPQSSEQRAEESANKIATEKTLASEIQNSDGSDLQVSNISSKAKETITATKKNIELDSTPVIAAKPPPLPKRDFELAKERDILSEIPHIDESTTPIAATPMSEGNGNGYSKEALPKSLPLPETSVKMAMLASPEGNITPCLSQPQPSFVEDSIPGNPPETSSLVVNTTKVEASETTPEQKPHETLSLPLQPDPDEKQEEKTFRLPVVPVVKTPDINLDVRKVKIRPPPSPKIKANKGLGEEKSLIAWSKDYLKSYKANVGVITNLTTSWRSGLAFCALLHKKFPELIPFKELTKAQDPEDNVMIAFQAGELVGVDFGSVSQDGFRANPDKATVVNLLKAFQACLDQPVDSIPEPDSVRLLDFQVGWFKKKGYFEKRVGDLVRKQEEDRLRVEAEAKAEYEAKVAEEEAKEREERERALKQQKELEREAQRKKLYENGQEASPVNQPDRSKHKDRIEAMIEEAHKYEEVSGMEELDKDEVIQVQADAGGQAKLIIPASTTPENGEDIESSSTSSSATEDNDGVVEPEEEVGQFHPSNTIMESLNQLEDEEVRVRKNKEELQEILAEEEDNKFMLEQTQKKYISCVNKLNSIEQQKNQLNFDMERQKINHEIKMVDAKLRKLCSIDDSRKTEAMRDEERLLNEKLEELMKDLVQLEVKKNMDATEAEEMAQSLNEMGQAFERGSNSYSSLPVRSQGGGGYQPSGTLKKLFFR